MSDIAQIRFIADSTDQSYWGSNAEEQAQIDMIRSEYADHLYDNDPPADVTERLAPVAQELMDATPAELSGIVVMYECGLTKDDNEE